MTAVQLYCFTVVFNCFLVVFCFPVCKAPVVIKVRFVVLKSDRLRETLHCLVEVTHPIERYTLIVISECVLRVNLYRSRVVSYRKLVLSLLIVGESSVEQGFKMLRVNLEGLSVQLNC